MPRTTTIEHPGCPPLRALTFDSLGLIKVIEARGKERSFPKIVDRWGDPDSSRCVLAVSMDDRKRDPLLAISRKSGAIEVLNPLNGDTHFTIAAASNDDVQSEDKTLTGLHLFKKQNLDQTARSCKLLTCTEKGSASVRSIDFADSSGDSSLIPSAESWKVCQSGSILCAKVDGSENYALFGGKKVEVNMWDIKKGTKIWTAKSPAKNSLGIFTPTWFTSTTFLSDEDHRKFVAGTNNHQVRLYDISAQRRPVLSFDFREAPIKSVAEDTDGHTIYVGNGSGDLASFDIRTGKLLGCFLGKCSGSIRSIVRHPHHPVIASCGLDSYLRIWDVKTRQLLSAIFLKQHLTNVVLDSSFDGEEKENENQNEKENEKQTENMENSYGDETETLYVGRKKKKEKRSRKKASDEDEEGSKKPKSKTRSKKIKHAASSDQEEDF